MKIKIKDFEKIKQEFGDYDYLGYISLGLERSSFVREMEYYCGKWITIKETIYCPNTKEYEYLVEECPYAFHEILIDDTKSNLKYKIIAVDLDETLIYSKYSYSYIDEVNEEAINVLNEYRQKGGKIIIWTLRTDNHLEYALEALSKAGLHWDDVNNNLQESLDAWDKKYPNMSASNKVCADMYIDDRSWPCNIIGINWKMLRNELLKMD